ncbi:MAG: two-component system response regulator [Myxococcales bacterium]|nr:two-component system response regulator [Myxococcales bacterium]|tara:strand:- start:770 stop:1882 length:1113 start_codon:yes stop_codon:yes gene_type:complete
MPKLLIVDDELAIQRLLKRLLEREGYECLTAGTAEEARNVLSETSVELVLSDVNMPGASGIELVQHIVSHHSDTPVVMVTAVDDPSVGRMAIDAGAYGYIIKPFEPNEVIVNVLNALRRRELETENQRHRTSLEQLVNDRTQALRQALDDLEHAHEELASAKEEVIRRLSIAAEIRDEETGQHIHRMSLYCALLARLVGLTNQEVELIRIASPLHDAGKIGIPDAILRKPGRHTTEEFEVMKMHAEIGYRILSGSGFPVLEAAATIAWTHHEKWDGGGYPRGLSGTDIPLSGRITAIADVFDALTTKRIYKPAFSVEKSVNIMREGRGKHFDPDILDLFLDNLDEVLKIRDEFPDEKDQISYEWPVPADN